ncbi:MFS transporter [Streptomyces sp. NPDC058783]|uniref:MFS transporter n=1 Tax=unclassified Streptomyces TaxID=2593676 RepID=UPI0026F12E0D|nr:MFS transporter [Streptomyces sp. HUAS CX7]WKX23640.1 MFS transporter [Streptomyces sp. HUAS CX7]
MLALTLITVTADFMVVPYFAVYFSHVLGLGVGFAAAALTTFTLLSKAAQVLGGWLTDRFTPDRLLAVGFSAMIVGYLALSTGRAAPAAGAGMLLLGLGDGFIVIAARYKLIKGTEAELHPRVFSLTSICFNLGTMAGPLAGVVLFSLSPSWTFVCAALIYLICFLALRQFTEPDTVSPSRATPSRVSSAALREILGQRSLLSAALLIAGFWVVFSQFQFSLPVIVTALDPAHSKITIATVFALNGGLIVLLSLPLTRALERRPATAVMRLGFLLLLLGYLLLAAVHGAGFPHLIYVPVVVLTVGEILFNTFANTHVAAVAPPRHLATCLGLLGLLTGIGTALGNGLSGALAPLLLAAGRPWLLWVVLVVVAALPLALAVNLQRWVVPVRHGSLEQRSAPGSDALEPR